MHQQCSQLAVTGMFICMCKFHNKHGCVCMLLCCAVPTRRRSLSASLVLRTCRCMLPHNRLNTAMLHCSAHVSLALWCTHRSLLLQPCCTALHLSHWHCVHTQVIAATAMLHSAYFWRSRDTLLVSVQPCTCLTVTVGVCAGHCCNSPHVLGHVPGSPPGGHHGHPVL